MFLWCNFPLPLRQIMGLQLDQVAAHRSFVFLWCGSSDGLDKGRQCLRKWGFRRSEDICWIKTNIKNPGHNKNLEMKAIFQRTKVRLGVDCQTFKFTSQLVLMEASVSNAEADALLCFHLNFPLGVI